MEVTEEKQLSKETSPGNYKEIQSRRTSQKANEECFDGGKCSHQLQIVPFECFSFIYVFHASWRLPVLFLKESVLKLIFTVFLFYNH